MAQTKIFFVSDLHGSERCFRKLVNAAKAYKPDYLICGGDVTGKQVVPIVLHPEGHYSATYLGSTVTAGNEDQLRQLEQNIRIAGFYFVHAKQEEIAGFTKEKVEEIFRREMRSTIENWVALADERLRGTGVKLFMMPGNDDPYVIDSLLSSSGCVYNADQRLVQVGPFEMITLGFANITPWLCPRDIPEEELEDKIDRLAEQVKDLSKCIFNLHVPPYDTQLDLAPQLDANLTPKLEGGGQFKMVPVGSKVVRKAIEKYQPMLGLHGHIHESRGMEKIGRTMCLNPGSEYLSGLLKGVFLSIDNKGRIDWALTAG
jgi:uncharacterized protein